MEKSFVEWVRLREADLQMRVGGSLRANRIQAAQQVTELAGKVQAICQQVMTADPVRVGMLPDALIAEQRQLLEQLGQVLGKITSDFKHEYQLWGVHADKVIQYQRLLHGQMEAVKRDVQQYLQV